MDRIIPTYLTSRNPKITPSIQLGNRVMKWAMKVLISRCDSNSSTETTDKYIFFLRKINEKNEDFSL